MKIDLNYVNPYTYSLVSVNNPVKVNNYISKEKKHRKVEKVDKSNPSLGIGMFLDIKG